MKDAKSNPGFISMKLEKKVHLHKGFDQALEMLVGFRKFMTFHVQANIN